MAYAGKSGQTPPPKRLAGPSARRNGTLAAGVAIGVLVGVGLALLLAPERGVDMRRRLRRRAHRLGLRGRDVWDELDLQFKRAKLKARQARRRAQLAETAVKTVI